MIPFTYRPKRGVEIVAHYQVDGDMMYVIYKGNQKSTARGKNEIGNAFLRENLLRTMMGHALSSSVD